MIELKKSVYKELNDNIDVDVYEFSRVDKDAILPYLTYNIINGGNGTTDNTDNIDFIVEVSVMDHNIGKDSTLVENKSNEIFQLMNTNSVIEPTFYWQTKDPLIIPDLPTIDEFTFRREVHFTLTTYVREV